MSSTNAVSAVDKNLEVKSLQEGVKLSQQEIVERAKDEINNSVEELAAGKKVAEVVNVGCLSHLAKLFFFWAVKTVAEEVDLSGSAVAAVVDSASSAVKAVVTGADLSGNYCAKRMTSNQGMRRKYFLIEIEIAFSLNHKPV